MIDLSTHKLPKSEFYLSTLYSLIFPFQDIKSISIHPPAALIRSPGTHHSSLGALRQFPECAPWHHYCFSTPNPQWHIRKVFLKSNPHYGNILFKKPWRFLMKLKMYWYLQGPLWTNPWLLLLLPHFLLGALLQPDWIICNFQVHVLSCLSSLCSLLLPYTSFTWSFMWVFLLASTTDHLFPGKCFCCIPIFCLHFPS